jgi:capsular polysaccharide biosynthesis protein
MSPLYDDDLGGGRGRGDTIPRVPDGPDQETLVRPGARGHGPAPRRLSGDEILRLCLLACLIVVIGAAIGYASSWLIQAQYGARSEILYTLREDQPTGFLREDRNLTTQVVLIDSRPVLEPVAAANGLSVDQLADKVGARVAEGSEIIEIEVRDADRAEGLRLVKAVTARYLAVTNDTTDEDRAYLERQLASIEAQLSSPATTPGLRAALSARRRDLLNRLDTLELSGPQARQLGAAYTTSDPVIPRRALAAAIGAVAALLVAAAVVALLALRWRRR